MNKSELRTAVSHNIRSYSDDYRQSLSLSICNKIDKDKDFLTADTIGLYVPMKDEVDIRYLIDKYSAKKKVFLPYIDDCDIMRFIPFTSWDKMRKSRFGIYEPILSDEHIYNSSPSLLVIPALAFDCSGYRLGRGGGYYDRYLSENSVVTIGVSLYSFVQFDIDMWDIPVNKVLNLDII